MEEVDYNGKMGKYTKEILWKINEKVKIVY